MEDILTLRIVLAIIAASAVIGGLFGALLFIFNEYAWKQFRKAKSAVSREQNNRLPPTTN
jgi:uncharacterized membrane protein